MSMQEHEAVPIEDRTHVYEQLGGGNADDLTREESFHQVAAAPRPQRRRSNPNAGRYESDRDHPEMADIPGGDNTVPASRETVSNRAAEIRAALRRQRLGTLATDPDLSTHEYNQRVAIEARKYEDRQSR